MSKSTQTEKLNTVVFTCGPRFTEEPPNLPKKSTLMKFSLTTPSFIEVTPEQIRNNQFGDSPNYIKRPTGEKGREKKGGKGGEQKERPGREVK